jgi:hypothetical protein
MRVVPENKDNTVCWRQQWYPTECSHPRSGAFTNWGAILTITAPVTDVPDEEEDDVEGVAE